MNQTRPRILIVDDNEALHEDFRLILSPSEGNSEIDSVRAQLFGQITHQTNQKITYDLDFAFRGEEAFRMVEGANAKGRNFHVAFIDMRMPPGWGGLETIRRIQQIDDELQFVICTAYSDHSWNEINQTVQRTDGLLILKKPFDNSEVEQIAAALCRKHELARLATLKMDHLEKLVENRTQEIVALSEEKERVQAVAMRQERQLLQKQKVESLGVLAGGVAHDVNNLLHVAQNFVEFAMTESDSPTVRRHLDVAHEAITEMSQVVRRILDFSRRQPDASQAIIVCDSIDRAIELVSPLLTGKHTINVLVALPSDYAIELEPSLLEQILINLCTNARDAMPEGTIDVHVGIVEFDAEHAPEGLCAGKHLQIKVTDTGAGIPTELRDQIFDPFITTKSEGHGTGLGLSIVAGAVHRHRGRIEIDSEVGKGSTFRVLIPAREVAPADATQLSIVPGSEHSTLKGVKVLVADDARPIRELAQLVLEDAGCEVVVAADGQEAFDKAKLHDDFEALILDVQMPHLDGYQVVQELESLGRSHPVIYCSGFNPYEQSQEVLGVPDSQRLSKPFSADELLNALSRLLSTAPRDMKHEVS